LNFRDWRLVSKRTIHGNSRPAPIWQKNPLDLWLIEWMAGAGIKRGYIHGATDELGFHAVEDEHYVTDIHATVLHLMGLDNRALDVPGRKRLAVDYPKVIMPVLS
jgi:hypothetical protein